MTAENKTAVMGASIVSREARPRRRRARIEESAEEFEAMRDEFEKLGFSVEETGGGCQWLRKQLSDSLSVVVTDGEAGLPDDLCAQLHVLINGDDIHGKFAGQVIATGDNMTASEMLDLLHGFCL